MDRSGHGGRSRARARWSKAHAPSDAQSAAEVQRVLKMTADQVAAGCKNAVPRRRSSARFQMTSWRRSFGNRSIALLILPTVVR